MNDSKVWLILGAENGLGAAAVKYLTVKKQIVIALVVNETACITLLKGSSANLHVIGIKHADTSGLKSEIGILTHQHGSINTIINNLDCQLFNQLRPECSSYSESGIENCINETLK